MQGSYIGYYSGFPSLGGGFDSRTLLHEKTSFVCLIKEVFSMISVPGGHGPANSAPAKIPAIL